MQEAILNLKLVDFSLGITRRHAIKNRPQMELIDSISRLKEKLYMKGTELSLAGEWKKTPHEGVDTRELSE